MSKGSFRKTEFTVQAYVAIDYYGNGVDAQVLLFYLLKVKKII